MRLVVFGASGATGRHVVCLGISRRTRSPFAPLVSPSDLTSRSVATIVPAMQHAGVRRIVYVSAFGAGDSWDRIPWWGRAFLRVSQVRHSMADHTRSEEILSSCALQWTSLRPMLLDDSPSTLAAREMQPGDSLLAKLSRESLARTIVAALGDRSTYGRAVPLVPTVTGNASPRRIQT